MNKIHLTDCVEGIRKLANESIDVIIADPPYNIGKDFGNESDKQEFNDYINWCDGWMYECSRVLKPNGSFFIYGFSEILAHLFVRIPLQKKWLVWSYTNKTTPTAKTWIRAHESIIQVFKQNPIFNQDDIRVPYSKDFSSLNGKPRPGTKGRFGTQETTYQFSDKGALPRDVISVPALAGGAGNKERFSFCVSCRKILRTKEEKTEHENHKIIQHPTQKPKALTETLIKSAINKTSKNTILIPFAGSGSECLVAKEMGLDWIAFEINSEYKMMGDELINEHLISFSPPVKFSNAKSLSKSPKRSPKYSGKTITRKSKSPI